MARARVLTEGPVRGSLIYLALPLLIGNILQQLYNTADAVIIGRWVNSAAFGAVGVAGTVMNLFIFVLSGACSGITVLFSQAYGAGDLGTFRRELYQSTLFGALFTLALGALATALLRPLLLVIQTPAELIGYASEYLRIIFAGFLATYAYNLCASALRSAGDTSASLCFLAVSIAANVGLDLLFVAVFGLGIGGAAWATVLAQLLSAAASLVYLRLRHPLLLFRRADMVIDRALLSRTVRFGAVAALHQSSVYIGKLLVQGAVNTLGAEAINAYTAATRIEGFANSFGDSGAAAEAVFIGQNVGGDRPDRVRRGFFIGLRLMVGLGLAMAAVMFIWAEPLSRLVLPDSNAAELAESVRYLRLVSLFYVLCFIGSLFVGYFEGIGRISIPTIGSAAHLSLRVVLAWLLVGRMGLAGLALATGLGWCLVVSFQLGVYRGVILKRRQV